MPNIKEQRDITTRTHSSPPPRSGRKVSLRREGLSLKRELEKWEQGLRVLSLRRDLLAWARWALAQKQGHVA